MTFDGLADLAFDGVELHGSDHAVLLCGNADQEKPKLKNNLYLGMAQTITLLSTFFKLCCGDLSTKIVWH